MKVLIQVLILAAALYGQPAPGFERVIGGSGFDRGVEAKQTGDGGYIAVGVTKSYGKGGDDVYLVKTDPAGRLEWSRSYGGKAEDNGWSVQEIADGFVVAGFTKSFGAGGYDYFVFKTRLNGEIVWAKTYGGKGDERAWAMIPASGGGFVVAGETTGAETGGEHDCMLVRIDPAGKEIWSRTYGAAKSDRCFSIAPAGDGGFVLAGQTYSEGAGDRDVFVIKTDSAGKKIWSRTFGGPASDVGHSIIRLSDDGFLVTGYTTSFAENGDDPYLIRLDSEGESVWTRVFHIDGIVHTLTGAQSTNGGFFLVGFGRYPEQGKKAAVLIKTDENGKLVWKEDILPTKSGDSFGYTVSATQDGGCVFAGHSSVRSAGDLDLLLVKVGNGKDVQR